jgi:hypothetical protein
MLSYGFRWQSAAQVLAIAALGFVWLDNSSQAQGVSEAQQDALRADCRSDFIANCSGVQPGGREALQCLENNLAKLSPTCQGAVRAVMPKSAEPPAAATPAAPPSAAAKPSAPPPTATTRPAAPPSAPATAAAPAAPAPAAAQREAVRVTCRRDYRRHCRGVPQGPEALACLQSNAARLTPNCRTSIAAIGNPQVTPPAEKLPLISRRMARRLPLQVRAAIVAACEPDRLTFCGHSRIGRGRLIACLGANISAVSTNCREALVGAFP